MGDVTNHGWLGDGHWLGVQGRKVLAQVGHWVHGDVADRLMARSQLNRASGSGGSQVGNMFGAPCLDDVVDGLDD